MQTKILTLIISAFFLMGVLGLFFIMVFDNNLTTHHTVYLESPPNITNYLIVRSAGVAGNEVTLLAGVK